MGLLLPQPNKLGLTGIDRILRVFAHDERALRQPLANLLSEKKSANAAKNERIAQGANELDALFASVCEDELEELVAEKVYA